MGAINVGLIVSLLSLGGCCLTVVSGERVEQTSGGATSGGGASGGLGSSGGGSSTGAALCSGLYCAPSFVCDPTNGCECGGQNCFGNCDASSGTCLPACVATNDGTYPVIGESPWAVQMAAATLGQAYTYTFQTSLCASPPIQWSVLSGSFENIGLGFYPQQGMVEGVPTVASGAMPFEFELEARDSSGNTGVQNYLLEVFGNPGP